MNLKINAPLDPDFMPMAVVFRDFTEAAKRAGGQKLVFATVRNNNYVSAFETTVYPDGTGYDDENFFFTERIVKTLLWTRGGYKIIISGSHVIADRVRAAYEPGGLREFDRAFMSRVFERPFEVEWRPAGDVPATYESASPVGRHLEGNRIGFDAGGSDRKVSAVIEGEAVFSEEVVWFPKTNSDPSYHYAGILEAMKTAAAHMPSVDAIGVSTAGVVIDNKIMVSSLFLKVSDDQFEKTVKTIYTDIAKEIGNVPVEVANDGDVTALAGAMDLNDVNVLGVAMGTSEAGGYVDGSGNIMGWLNELAFVPADFNRFSEFVKNGSAVDEWSGDYGCGVKYFSQDAVIKLAPKAGIELDSGSSPAEKLKTVQNLMKTGDRRAVGIYETIGVYFGYAVAYYALFYDIRHVLLMGRVSSGDGGTILLREANRVLSEEFPELGKRLRIHLPDESSRRVGQSIAAASLPDIR